MGGMKTPTFTFPGKCGDALHQWPCAFWWHRQTGQPFDVWLDEHTCRPLVHLFQTQPGVQNVELKPGIDNWSMGGQPWHFNLEPEEHADRQFIHLGMRTFPQKQITLHALEQMAVRVEVDRRELAEIPSLVCTELPPSNRVLIHGTGICAHNKRTPELWPFVASIRGLLEREFEEIVFVGSDSDRATGLRAYPNWSEFKDDGDFYELAAFMKASRLVLACGSVVAALAGQLKTPCVRVHDDIGGAAKVIWSNLGSNQLNATELELRTQWPEFRDRVLEARCPTN